MILEAALIMPLFLLLIMGFMEVTNLFKDNMSINNAAHDAAREASAAGASYDADFAMLVVARRSLNTVSGRVDRVVVFRATDSNATVPNSCKTMSVSATGTTGSLPDLCTVYGGQFVKNLVEADRANFGDNGTGAPKYDVNYPALDRQQSKSAAKEYIGVYVKASYRPITKAVPTPNVLESTSVFPIEPRTA